MLAEVVLFILLSPGLLLTLPRVGKKMFMSCQTSTAAVFVHALIFAFALMYLHYIPILNQLDGFQNTTNPGGPIRPPPLPPPPPGRPPIGPPPNPFNIGSGKPNGIVSGATQAVGGIIGAAGAGLNSITTGVQKNISDIGNAVKKVGL